MATNPIPSRGAKLLAVSGQENHFFIYRDVSKTSDSRRAADFDRVVSAGTLSTDTTGSVWLSVFGYKNDSKDSQGYVLIDDQGTIWEGQPFVSKPAPEIPGPVKIESLSGGKGVLSWTPIADAAVEIEFASTVQGPFRLIAIFRGGGSSYDINNLTEGVIFYYRVRSTNDYGESEYSNIVSVTAVDSAESSTLELVGPAIASPATPGTQQKVNQHLNKSAIDDADVVPTQTEQPIITWVRRNPVYTLTIGAGIVVALMMIILAGRRP